MAKRERRVAIVSTRVDVSTDAVVRELGRRGIPCMRFNTDEFPYDARLTTRIDSKHASASLRSTTHAIENLDSATGVWFRRIRTPMPPPNSAAGVHEYCINESRAALIGSLIGTQKRTMSPPHAIWRAEHKIEQLRVAARLGFTIPQTTVTNDPDEVRRAYAATGGRLVVKAVRRGYIRLGDDDERAVYTSIVKEEHLDRDAAIQLAPAIYQRLVAKRCDVRATVVGGKLFAAEIDSQQDPEAVTDWRRTSDPELPHRRAELPAHLRVLIQGLMTALELRFGAIDLVRTPDDEYVFLEVNPNGQWLWLDDQLDLGITSAIASWLAGVD